MADETVVAAGDVTEEVPQVTPEDSTPAEPTVGEEQEPQGTENEGEHEQERRRKGGWQRKIERLETEREFLMQELLKHRSSEPEQQPKPVEPSVEAKAEPTPQDFDLGDGTYDIVKFNKAHFAWLKAEDVRQTEAVKKAESSKSEDKQIFDSWIASRDKAAEKYADMEEVLQVPVIPDSKSHPEKYKFVSREIMSSPYAGELAYYLGKHPEEAFALWEKPNNEIIRGLGRIEAQFARAESAEPDKPKEAVIPPVTRAPKPPTPVAKPAAVKTFDVNDPKTPWSEWKKEREAQLKRT
jgi:hypothetical protein